MNQRRDKIPSAVRQFRLKEAIERLVRLYEAKGQPDKAENGRNKLPK